MVVVVGLTVKLPLVDWLPIPLSIETLLAFVVVQVNVVGCPLMMVVGLAENWAVGAGTAATDTVTDVVAVAPLGEAAVR